MLYILRLCYSLVRVIIATYEERLVVGMNMIHCKQCGEAIEVSAALQGQIEAQVLAAERGKHQRELDRVMAEAAEAASLERTATQAMTQKHIDGERELLRRQSAAELEISRKQLEFEASNAQKKAIAQNDMMLQTLQEDKKRAEEAKTSAETSNRQLRDELSELMKSLREEKRARENAEVAAQKKLSEEEAKIREQAGKEADERQRLNLAARDKTISDLQKSLDEAQRKAAQGSQQLQGEIMELDFERALTDAWHDDDIVPIAKGVKGGDIRHVVRSSRGIVVGVMLWEIKRTKNWTDSWIAKLKQDLRNEKANIPIIITEVMPKQIEEDMGLVDGVWVCKPKLAIVLSTLLRRGLLDAGQQRALAENRGNKADALYNFVTSHEFSQQIEAMVETYQEMSVQIQKERIAYEKLWAQREKQTQKLFISTANVVGSMQGYVGQSSMPRIKGLELDDDDDTTTLETSPEALTLL